MPLISLQSACPELVQLWRTVRLQMGDAHVAQALAILYEQQARERSRGVDIEELSAFAADGLSAFLQTDTLSGEGGGLVFARRVGTCLTSSSRGLGTQRQLCVTPRSLSLYGPCLHAEDSKRKYNGIRRSLQ